jgi:hypothetical protein
MLHKLGSSPLPSPQTLRAAPLQSLDQKHSRRCLRLRRRRCRPVTLAIAVGDALDAQRAEQLTSRRLISACTLLTGIAPRHHVCVTKRAVLGFHAASYYDDVSRSLVPTRAGTRRLMRLYPHEVRSWIDRHGGLTPHLMTMHGRDLAALYPRC